MEEGVVMMTGLEMDRILDGLAILEHQSRGAEKTIQLVHDYDVSRVAEKVLRILLSYTDSVNRVVWRQG
jgi:UDP-N-acetylglucosamine 2-epimerase (non-hydrolysing)